MTRSGKPKAPTIAAGAFSHLWFKHSNNQQGDNMSQDQQQAAYDTKVDQIATAKPPKLTAGPFNYHRPVMALEVPK
jgi:hypothetical protein